MDDEQIPNPDDMPPLADELGPVAGADDASAESAPDEAAYVPRTSRRPQHGRSRRRSELASHARRAPSATRRASGLPTSERARSRRTVVGLTILAVIIGVLAFTVWSTLYRAEAGVPSGRSVTVVIAKGSSGDVVAARLAKAGVVPNALMFRLQAMMLNATSSMKAGTYTLVTGSSYEAVIRRLQAGPPAPVLVTITIPEGWGIDRIAARVEALVHIPAADFVQLAKTGAKQFDYAFLDGNPTDSLEGYLFPKTYEVKPNAKAADIIGLMLAQYGKETASLDYGYATSKGLTHHDALTLASIIEREASVPSDRPKVASVIYNRLGFHMRLQLDSTVQFALNGKAKLSLEDLKTQSPYNTYVNAGLPPGPICNPGLVAMQAALAPAKTKYLYYILTYKDGRQSFATNYADFLVLKAQFKKGLK